MIQNDHAIIKRWHPHCGIQIKKLNQQKKY